PAIPAPTAPAVSELIVFANGISQVGRATQYASDGAGTKEPGTILDSSDCDRAGTSSLIAYDLKCRLELPDHTGGDVVLELQFNDGFGTTDYRFNVYLPERAP